MFSNIDAGVNAKAALPDAKYKMVAQWNNCHDPTATSCLHPVSEGDSGVYMMKSADGVAFEPMFGNRSLDWSDTKNVMWFDQASAKYVRLAADTDEQKSV